MTAVRKVFAFSRAHLKFSYILRAERIRKQKSKTPSFLAFVPFITILQRHFGYGEKMMNH